MSRLNRDVLAAIAIFGIVVAQAFAQKGAENGQWRHVGGDTGVTHYAPLDQINRDNVKNLTVAWTWTTADAPLMKENTGLRASYFQGTPLVIDGVMYISTCLSQAAALNPKTGEQLWVYNPQTQEAGRPPNLGWCNRGLAAWGDGQETRLFLYTNNCELIALDSKDGKPIESFGDQGRVHAAEGIPRARPGRGYGNTSAPLVCRDVVVVGSNIGDGSLSPQGPPGRVRAYDVKTGKMRWEFKIIPDFSDPAFQTWEDDSASYTGAGNVWSGLSGDEELGYVYLPTTTPTSDYFGGHRRGDNLYAESIVCVEAQTGKKVWHYQAVHHGLWDYDFPTPPIVCDITVDGRRVKALAALSKQAFCYVFDRATGEPVWPTIEKPVPPSLIPGEYSSPTQPFPTKPPAFDRQGVTEDDLMDLTPELKSEALALFKKYLPSPLFAPPSTDGVTIQLPGNGGGANWMGGSFDPETGMIYIPSMTSPMLVTMTKPDPSRSSVAYTRGGAGRLTGPQGLPLLKPPYGRITAIDLNKGEIVWMQPNGADGPVDHPAIKHLGIKSLGSLSRAGALTTKTLMFASEGAGHSGAAREAGTGLRAYDKKTGEIIHRIETGEITNVPMTYMVDGKQYVVVGLGCDPPKLVALALP